MICVNFRCRPFVVDVGRYRCVFSLTLSLIFFFSLFLLRHKRETSTHSDLIRSTPFTPSFTLIHTHTTNDIRQLTTSTPFTPFPSLIHLWHSLVHRQTHTHNLTHPPRFSFPCPSASSLSSLLQTPLLSLRPLAAHYHTHKHHTTPHKHPHPCSYTLNDTRSSLSPSLHF